MGVLAILALASRPAFASPPRPLVLLRVDTSCDRYDRGEMLRLVALELRADVELERPLPPESPSARPEPVRRFAATQVALQCLEGAAEVQVDDPLTAKRVARRLDLSSTGPSLRTRVLAIGVSELVLASWAELAAPLAASASASVSSPSSGERAEARRIVAPSLAREPELPRSRLRLLSAALQQTYFSKGAGALWGAGLALGRDEARHLGWLIEGQALHGQTINPSGRVTLDLVVGGAAMWMHHTWRRVTLRGGVGLRGGAARFAGTAAEPTLTRGRVVWRALVGADAAAALELAAHRRLSVQLGIEVGYVALRAAARAYGYDVVAIDGPWIGVQLGLVIFP